MQSFINKVSGRQPVRSRDEVSMPLHTMRPSSNDGPPFDSTDERFEYGDRDADPLLPSDGDGLGRVKAEIEHELASSGGDTTYDRRYSHDFCIHSLVFVSFSRMSSHSDHLSMGFIRAIADIFQ